MNYEKDVLSDETLLKLEYPPKGSERLVKPWREVRKDMIYGWMEDKNPHVKDREYKILNPPLWPACKIRTKKKEGKFILKLTDEDAYYPLTTDAKEGDANLQILCREQFRQNNMEPL